MPADALQPVGQNDGRELEDGVLFCLYGGVGWGDGVS